MAAAMETLFQHIWDFLSAGEIAWLLAVVCMQSRAFPVQEEATGYEAPRKSFKKAAESQSWQAATACLASRVAKLSVDDAKVCVRSG